MNLVQKCLSIFILLFIPITSFSQSNIEYIWRPILGYSWSENDRLSYTIKLEMFNSIEDYNNHSAIQYIEPQLSVSYTLSPDVKIGGGFYSKWSDPLLPGYAYEQRLLQQISYKTPIGDEDINHRARLEQRFRSSSYINRFRYLLGHQIPLPDNNSGSKERFLIIENDVLLAFNSSSFSGENRLSFGIGWKLPQNRQFQLSLGHRLGNLFTDSEFRHKFVLTTSLSFRR